MNEIITITISDFLTNELAEKICLSQWHNNSPKFINQIRRFSVYDGKRFSDCFNVVATNQSGDVIGRLYCLKNRKNENLWYYGDLFVSPNYRRNKIATKMLEAAMEKLKESGAEILRAYVEPANTASINLQKSLGFIEKPYEVFDHLLNEGDIMFELCLPSKYEVIPATAEEAIFICMFYAQNIEALHGKEIPLSEWKEILSKDDPDEQNFLICKGAMPVAWLRVNGLSGKETAWISMLVVSNNAHRQGVGSFAVKYAEEFVQSKGFTSLGIKTTADNVAAVACYKKLGYEIIGEHIGAVGDGVKRPGYTLHRDFIQYKQLCAADIQPDMLKHFNRYQEVKKSWRNQNGEWVLIDNYHTGNWDEAKKIKVATEDFTQIIRSGGSLFCAFDNEKLIGFCGFDGNFMGSDKQYLWLVYLHVSYEYRKKGIGRKLFDMTANAAKKLGAKKLYISANSSQESQAFYRAMGCVNADEIIPELFEAEPYDVHMEYSLLQI